MKLVLISDTHCQHLGLQMPEGDVLIHSGDWTGRGSEMQTIEFLQWLEAQPYKHKLFIAGNHDFYPERHPKEFRELVAKYAPGCTYLQDEAVEIGGHKFYGSPVTPWFHDWAFNRHRGESIQRYWDQIPDDVDVLITHGPMQGFGDKLSAYGSEPGEHVGCTDLLNTTLCRLHKLKLHVCGHIHEGAGIYTLDHLLLINASVLDEHYRLVNAPRTIELPDKTVPDITNSYEQEGKTEAEETQEDEDSASRQSA